MLTFVSMTGLRWLAVLLLLVTDAAFAADPPASAGHLQTPIEALEQDAAEYAKLYDLPVAQAAAQLDALDASVADTDRIAAQYRNRLAGISIEHQPALQIVVLLTGVDPVGPDAPIASAGIPIAWRYAAGATRDQLLAAIDAHQADLIAALPRPPGLGVDARTGALAVMVEPEEIAAEGQAVLIERLTAIAGMPVELRVWGSDANADAEGGGRLVGRDVPDGPRFVCTGGFVVTDGTQAGLATAAHCPDTPDLIEPGAPPLPTTLIGAWGARYQDVQIQSLSIPATAAFYVDRKAEISRPVATWRNRTSTRVGDLVCHRGERTGFSCSEVEYVDYAPAGDLCAGPCTPTWAAARGPHCGGGDSGGPVFRGTTALGLFKGGSYAPDGRCAVWYYMSIDYLPPGWQVLREGFAAPTSAATVLP